MNKRAGKKRTTFQNTQKSENQRSMKKMKIHDKRTMQQKNNNMNSNSDQFAVSDYHMIDIEI
jgi:hypothetical protein